MEIRTDEYNKVKADIEQLEDQLDDAQDELRQGVWQRRAKAIAIVITAVAGLVTAILAHFRPETVAEHTAGVTAKALTDLEANQTKALQGVQAACQRVAQDAADKAKAEADSVRTLVLGYLLAQRGKGPRAAAAALDKAVKQLGSNSKGLEPLIKTRPPPKPDKIETQLKQLRQISKGSN